MYINIITIYIEIYTYYFYNANGPHTHTHAQFSIIKQLDLTYIKIKKLEEPILRKNFYILPLLKILLIYKCLSTYLYIYIYIYIRYYTCNQEI